MNNYFDDSIKKQIKENLHSILKHYGAKQNNQGNWNCVSSRHKNPKNNLSVREDTCCCHCGIKGDAFNVIAEMEDIDIKSNFYLVVKRGFEILSLNNGFSINKESSENEKTEHKPNNYCNISNLTNIITNKFKKSKKSDYAYFEGRGFSYELIKKHQIIVEDPRKIFNINIIPKLNNIWAYRYIIPVVKNENIVNCILRRDDKKSREGNKTLNLKNCKVYFLNEDLLAKDNNKYIFICEGWADAMSFEEIGYSAIAINSIVMIKRLTSIIKANLEKFKNTKFLICFDNDKYGKKAAKELQYNLRLIDLDVYNLSIKDESIKDINEYYVKDINFKKNVENILKFIEMVKK